jgi:cephalosporin-C deacetylase-like acetyl esterase
MLTDLDEAALHTYRSSVVDPRDFDEFWARTIEAPSAISMACPSPAG